MATSPNLLTRAYLRGGGAAAKVPSLLGRMQPSVAHKAGMLGVGAYAME